MVEEIVLPAALRDTDLGSDVVEVGPGPGFTTDVLRTRVAQLTAVELDPDLAGALAQRLGGTNVAVILGDATALDLPTGRFTGAVAFNMLHHVPTDDGQDRVFAELARVAAQRAGSSSPPTACAATTSGPFTRETRTTPSSSTACRPRLAAAGFAEIQVRTYDLGWTCSARAA